MSLGYVKGKYWVPDSRFDVYSSRDSYKRLLKAVRIARFAFEVSFSYTAQRYTAEVLTNETFKNSAQVYIIKHNNAYDPNPMAAAVQAITAFERCTPLIRAICLEIECELLRDTLSAVRRVEAGIEKIADELAALLAVVPLGDYLCEDCIGMAEYGCFCKANGALAPGGPMPKPIPADISDIDDDL